MVKFKGIDFKSKGIIVEKTPTISKGKKDIETYSIPGRNGFLSIDKNTYQPFSVSIECHAKETADFDEIKAFLDGYGTLSFDNDREYTAIVNNAIPFEKVQMFKSFVVQFMVNPIAHDINETEYTVSSASDTLTINGGNTEIEPILEIVGSGNVSITINNKTFNLIDLDSSKTYTLDSNLKIIVDNNGVNRSNQMLYAFPILYPGENEISYIGTISSFKIKYKKSYL